MCGTQCCSIKCSSVYLFYSPAAPPIEPDSASESTVFGTVLYCKAARDTACNSIAQPTELSIETPVAPAES